MAPSRIGRRTMVLGACAAALGCSKTDAKIESRNAYAALNQNAPPDAGPQVLRVVEWSFASDASEATRAAIVLPPGPADAKFPVLVALHGRGEARKGPELGALGWPRDYALVRGIRRLVAPPLKTDDFEGFVTPARLAKLNDDLAAAPYRGVVVVCPYLPDVDLKSPLAIRDYGAFVKHVLLPRARKELPVFASRDATGIDGVSLGGAMALRVGLGNPDEFGMVGSLQAAIDDPQIPQFVDALRLARAANPKVRLRLVTSDRDYFRRVVTATSQAMRSANLDHDFLEVPGPHDYPFNRGPGALEMMIWHDHGLARA